MADWQTVEQLPSAIVGGGLTLHQMIQASIDFAKRWGAQVQITEPLPEPCEPIPGDGMAVNLVSGTLAMGGAERHTVELACALHRLGYKVTVLVRDLWSPHQPHMDRLKSAGVPTAGIDCDPPAQVTIWWGASMLGRNPAGSIYVAHSASKLVQRAIERCSEDIGRIVGVSRAATAVALQAGPEVKASTIWNGVEPPTTSRAPRSGAYTVGYLGRYDTEKGVALAIAALAHAAEDIRLRCYGRGPHKGALAAAADDHGVGDRVDVCGVAPDFAAVAHEFDALIVPDLVQGFPMTVCEALLHGVPVVAVNMGDLQHVLADGRGVAVEPSSRGLARGITEVREMPAASTAWAEKHLTADAMAASYTHVIGEML